MCIFVTILLTIITLVIDVIIIKKEYQTYHDLTGRDLENMHKNRCFFTGIMSLVLILAFWTNYGIGIVKIPFMYKNKGFRYECRIDDNVKANDIENSYNVTSVKNGIWVLEDK